MSRCRRWMAVAAWLVVILILTSLPGPTLAEAPNFSGADRVAHLTLDEVSGALVPRADQRRGAGGRVAVPTMVAGIALFAPLDKSHQQRTPGRRVNASDWIAGAARPQAVPLCSAPCIGAGR